MGGEWRESTIGELIENGKASLQTGPFGTALKASEYSKRGVPLISVGEIREGYLQITEDTPRVDKATTQRLPKFVLHEGDIVFGRKGAVDRNARISKEQDGWFLGSDGIRLRVSDEYDSDFLSYQMRSSLVRNWLLQNSAGTTMLSLNQKVLSLVRLVLPDLETQRNIGSILRALDDKIEVNRAINRTLEAMAQTIFKSWFVDFDPVKAKMAARESGADPTRAAMAVISGKNDTELDAFQQQDPKSYERLRDTAEAFPEALVESELGLIPEGWGYQSAESVATVGIGKTPPRKEAEWFSESCSDVKWVSIRDMGTSGTYMLDTSEYLTGAAVDKFNVRRIPDNTVLLSFKLTVGRVAITVGEMLSNEAIAHFVPKARPGLTTEYLYHYLKQFDYETLGSTSSIARAVNSKTIKDMQILVPDGRAVGAFQSSVSGLMTAIKAKQIQSVSLVEARDKLLPRLLSGELV